MEHKLPEQLLELARGLRWLGKTDIANAIIAIGFFLEHNGIDRVEDLKGEFPKCKYCNK